MNSSEYEQWQVRTEELQSQVDLALEGYEQQMRMIAEARDRLATATVEVWSADNLVRVTTNSAGIPLRIEIGPEAFKRSTPQKLGASVTEAAQAAARTAKAQLDSTLEPILAQADRFTVQSPFGDTTDIRGIAGSLLPPPPESVESVPSEPLPPERVDDEDDRPHWQGW